MGQNKYIFILVSFFFFISCKKNNDSLLQVKKIGDISYELMVIPKEEMVHDEIKPADLMYFKLSICDQSENSKNISSLFLQSNYNKLLFYINQQINSDFEMENSDGNNYPIQVFFENNNRIAKKLVFLIAFEKYKKEQNNFTITFNDKIFNNGKVKFLFTNEEAFNK